MSAQGLLRRLLVALTDTAPAFTPKVFTGDKLFQRLLVALADASPAFQGRPRKWPDSHDEDLRAKPRRRSRYALFRSYWPKRSYLRAVTLVMSMYERPFELNLDRSARPDLPLLIAALDETNHAVIHISHMLIFKNAGAIVVHQLTDEQIRLLEQNPRLLDDYHALLDALSIPKSGEAH